MLIALYKMEEKGPHSLKFYRRIGESEIPSLTAVVRLSDGRDVKSYYYDEKFSKEAGHPAYILQNSASLFVPVDVDGDSPDNKNDSNVQQA
jgi:hypothetical protein